MSQSDIKNTSAIPVVKGEKTEKVYVPKEKGDNQTHLFVSINERNFAVKKGEWVEVPVCVARLLERREKMAMIREGHLKALMNNESAK